MVEINLSGKVAMVTGATGGIGAATCRLFAQAGADVAICYGKNSSAADALLHELEEMDCRAAAFSADVANRDEVFNLVDEVSKKLGNIDILVNNAGITMTGAIEEMTESGWDRCLETNLKSVLFATQAVLPSMKSRRQGWIINISSLAAKSGAIHSASAYVVSKAGVSGFTIQTAKETLAYHINVNAIAPGVIDTPLWDAYGNEKKEKSFTSLVRGPGTPRDVANAILFLASPMARYITGEILDVNGGLLMD